MYLQKLGIDEPKIGQMNFLDGSWLKSNIYKIFETLNLKIFLYAGLSLKSEPHYPKKLFYFASMKVLLKMMKDAFYFMLKPLFIH